MSMLILHNQLALTKFGRRLRYPIKMSSIVQEYKSIVQVSEYKVPCSRFSLRIKSVFVCYCRLGMWHCLMHYMSLVIRLIFFRNFFGIVSLISPFPHCKRKQAGRCRYFSCHVYGVVPCAVSSLRLTLHLPESSFFSLCWIYFMDRWDLTWN